ncbi:MAG TPA: hypothetical protein VES20_10340, partial [Bryobacteraceae bacterium]|nr:hypothetical protein [Bryobacteraceae bacterium]
MHDFEKLGAFYLGRLRENGQTFLYDSRDLVTHAVCVGMTGSGKTGLCIDLLEEAAIDGIPALVIDPKGDISNLLLQFPDLRPEDFRPWVDEDEARREGITVEEFAAQHAAAWKDGLAAWGQSGERIRKLSGSAEFAVYTPGSDAGTGLSVLRSFDPPPAAAADDRESWRDRISGTATALLSLLGSDAEPSKSREHILISTILDKAWQDRRSLSVEALIHEIQKPAFTKIGVMDLESFYPAQERFELSMSLNNLLASPGFEAWMQGEPLDIGGLLYTAAGKPRIAILSIAHLNDSERMFLVTLVLNEVLAWMRAQPGTTSLRALVYMDEIFGYFPPVANPPSKRPLLTLLKQARAFGIGIVLATQNPVDLDYKGLANAGTWFIGRLQTDRDRQRLIDGLEGAVPDRAALDSMLSGLGKRVFLMNNVHETKPVVFESRWALSYLRGPLTRAQLRLLKKDRAAPAGAANIPVSRNPEASSRPVVPPSVPQSFLPLTGSAEDVIYEPAVLGCAQIRYVDTKARIDFVESAVFLTPVQDDALPVEWEECTRLEFDVNGLEHDPAPGVSFATLPSAAANPKSYAAWSRDLAAWIGGHQQLTLLASPARKLYSAPGEPESAFRARLALAMREERDAALAKIQGKYATKIAALQDKARRAEQVVNREREQARAQQMNAALSVGADLLGAFFGRRKMVTAAGSAMRGVGRAARGSGDASRAEE